MERKKDSVTAKSARYDLSPARRANFHGGTIINIVTAIVFFGLIALAVLWVFNKVNKGH